MALPVSAGYQARIDLANTGLAGLPGIFNPRRRSLAYDTAADLNEGGYFEGLEPEEVREGGNVTYRLVRGRDGRLYMQAYRQTSQQFNERGTFYSSFHQRAQREQRASLDAARNAIMRQFGQQQAGLTGDQAGEERRLRGELATTRGEYADWQASQPVAPPPPAPAAAPGPGGAPGGGVSGARVWIGRNEPNLGNIAATQGVRTDALRVTRSGDGRYVVTRR